MNDFTNIKPPVSRPVVAAMHAYVPGEQPVDPLLVKLNTNENPYPPSHAVLQAIAGITAENARKYPEPTSRALRTAIAGDLGVAPEQVIAGNGSDEILKMLVEAFVDPGQIVAYLWPTYSLYPVFVEKAAARECRLSWSAATLTQEEALLSAPADTRLFFVTNPNPPVGLPVSLEAIRDLAARFPNAVIAVDEAYIAYGGESAIALVREGIANIVVTRTFSKSHSLAGLRAGFAVGHAEVVGALHKVRDSYNLNAVTQAAALAAWQDHSWTADVVGRIVVTRDRTLEALRARDFAVEDSAGNFLFARRVDAREVFARLRAAHVLVRYFGIPELADGLRITIGTDAQMARLLEVLDA